MQHNVQLLASVVDVSKTMDSVNTAVMKQLSCATDFNVVSATMAIIVTGYTTNRPPPHQPVWPRSLSSMMTVPMMLI